MLINTQTMRLQTVDELWIKVTRRSYRIYTKVIHRPLPFR